MSDPWQFNTIASGGLNILPDDLRYFNDYFVGKPMRSSWNDLPKYTLAGRSRQKNDFLVWHTAAPVASERALSVLRSTSPTDFESLPFPDILGSKYYAINVIAISDCIDFNNSEIQFYGDKEYGVPRRIVLKSALAIPFGIFKMKRIPGYVFVSDQLANRLIDEGLTGLGLTKLSTDVLARAVLGKTQNDHPGLET